MFTLEQLEEWFTDVEYIVHDLHVSVRNLKRLSVPKDRMEEQVVENGFFEHVSRMLHFTMVVQLCKLYVDKDTERRNFRKLFNRLKYEPYHASLTSRLRENKDIADRFVYKKDIIREVDHLIQLIEARTEQIERLKTLRDRFYAHTDPGKPLPLVTLTEMEEMTHLAGALLNALRGGILGGTFVMNENEGWSVEPVLRAITHGPAALK
jgi:hypothetical protein